MKLFFIDYGSYDGAKEYIREVIICAKDYPDAADTLARTEKELYNSSVRIISSDEYNTKKSSVITINQSRCKNGIH